MGREEAKGGPKTGVTFGITLIKSLCKEASPMLIVEDGVPQIDCNILLEAWDGSCQGGHPEGHLLPNPSSSIYLLVLSPGHGTLYLHEN